MNVGVVELNWHWEYLRTITRALTDVCVVMSPKVAEIMAKEYEDVCEPSAVCSTPESAGEVLKDCERVFVNTAQTAAMREWVRKNAERVVLTVHNFHAWRKEDLERVHTVVSIDPGVARRASRTLGRKIEWVPWRTNGESTPRPRTFVVPGQVERTRREYGQVLRAAQYLATAYDDVEFVLLGHGKDSTVMREASQVNERVGRECVQTYDGFVGQAEYEMELRNGDVFIAPVSRGYELGITKASAAMWEGVTRGRPVLVPEWTNFDARFVGRYGRVLYPYRSLKAACEEWCERESMPTEHFTELDESVVNARIRRLAC